MSESVQQHREAAGGSLSFGVITVSDTRTVDTDTGGKLIVEMLVAAGHVISGREIVTDDRELIVTAVLDMCGGGAVDAIITTGGTGVSRRDTTFEALTSIMDRRLDGFGELFRALSFEEIGAAAMLSRATAGVVGATAIFALPGSRNAIRLAMERLVLPEIGHVVFELRK